MAKEKRDDESGDQESAGDDANSNSGLSQQRSAADSVWAAEAMSFPREVMFVALVCMAQFCTREFA